MIYALIYLDGFINKLMDSLPEYLKSLRNVWESIVDRWNEFLAGLTHNYFIINNSRQILIGLIIFVVLAVLLTVWLILRSRKKPVIITKVASPKQAKKAAKQAAKSGNMVRAGELYEQALKFNKAVDCYMKGRATTRAANVYAKFLNQPERALEILLEGRALAPAADLLSELDRHEEAANYYLEAGREQTAAEAFEKAGQLAKAGEYYKRQKRFNEAALCFSKVKDWLAAGQMYEVMFKQYQKALSGKEGKKDYQKLQDLAKKTGYHYKQGGQFQRAAQVMLEAKLPTYAAELFILSGDHARAADLFLEEKEFKRAAELMNKAGDRKRAAEIMAQYHQAEGNSLESAKYLEIAEDYLAAADIYAGEEDYEKSAAFYLKGGDSRTASEMFILAGQTEKAVRIFEEQGDFESAIRFCEESGNHAALAGLYERSGRVYDAGLLFLDRGMVDKAIEMFNKISPDHAHYAEALFRQGGLFMEKGEFQLALEKLQAMAGRLPLGPSTLDHYYLLGMAYERLDHPLYAVGIYQQIMGLNYHYKDVVMRINALGTKLAQQGGAYAATQAGGGWSQSAGTIGKRYKVIKELGRGGMGVVYMAEDLHLGRNVAFKVLSEEFKANTEMVRIFIREAKSLAKLSHPYIVSIFDAGEEGGIYYIIMEFVEGKDFKEMLGDNRRLPLAAGVQVFTQLSQAMDYAHSLKIIHRDIKPANIMWTQTQIIKVMDFGLATVVDQMRKGKTMVAGTPYYMSPEQSLGKNVDHRADIYSMGVTIYELLTGKVPFSEGDIGYHHLHTPPPPPAKLNSQISPELERIILKCMAKDMNQRYQSAKEVYEELLRCASPGRS